MSASIVSDAPNAWLRSRSSLTTSWDQGASLSPDGSAPETTFEAKEPQHPCERCNFPPAACLLLSMHALRHHIVALSLLSPVSAAIPASAAPIKASAPV